MYIPEVKTCVQLMCIYNTLWLYICDHSNCIGPWTSNQANLLRTANLCCFISRCTYMKQKHVYGLCAYIIHRGYIPEIIPIALDHGLTLRGKAEGLSICAAPCNGGEWFYWGGVRSAVQRMGVKQWGGVRVPKTLTHV